MCCILMSTIIIADARFPLHIISLLDENELRVDCNMFIIAKCIYGVYAMKKFATIRYAVLHRGSTERWMCKCMPQLSFDLFLKKRKVN